MANQDPQIAVAMVGLGLVGIARLLARLDKTAAMLRGDAWDADEIPASWHRDQAIADQVAREHMADREERAAAHLRAAHDAEWPSR